jgi:O-antigen ligase
MVFLRKFAIITYILLVYSGLIKWIPGLPVDLTLLFSAILLVIFPFLFRPNFFSSSNFEKFSISSVLGISLLFLFSNTYSISTDYAASKSVATLLNIFCFLYPLFIFKATDFSYVKKVMMVFNVIILGILSFLYFTDQLIYFQMSEKTIESVIGYAIPNYLSIGTFISVSILLQIDNKNLLSRFVMIYSLFILFVLGGRGPLIFLLFIFILYYFLTLKVRKFSIKNVIILLLGIVLFMQYFDSSGIDFTRYNVFENFNEDKSATERIYYLENGYRSVTNNMWTGLGIGSSGLILSDQDYMLYPHNLFLESLMEIGILGGLLYLFLYLFLFFKTFAGVQDRALFILGLISLYLFFQDMKSGSFDSWRISLMWIALFIIQYHSKERIEP